ncbi:hypothetical protein CS8_017160 [Cupriavidus sp. 8B]
MGWRAAASRPNQCKQCALETSRTLLRPAAPIGCWDFARIDRSADIPLRLDVPAGGAFRIEQGAGLQ